KWKLLVLMYRADRGEYRQSCQSCCGELDWRAIIDTAFIRSADLMIASKLTRLTAAIAIGAAVTCLGAPSSRAGGNAPWCAVINIGTGTVYWDCQYPTFEACYHLGNILAGNRGFCNLNPWPGPSLR